MSAMAVLDLLREAFVLTMCYKSEEAYNPSNVRLITLWVSISYLIMIIFCGI